MKKMSNKEKKNESLKYSVNAVLNEAAKKGYHSIGITSTLGLEVEIQNFCELCNHSNRDKNNNIKVYALESVIQYADALEQMKKYDCAVLIEKYAYTTYRMIEKMIEYLEDAEVDILGVVNIK